MTFLRNISIRVRLMMIISGIILGMAILLGANLYSQKSTLYSQQQAKVKALVENAYSIVDKYHQQQLSGALSVEQAQKLAIESISLLRYEDNNYFWINDSYPNMIMHPFKPQLNGTSIRDNKDPDGVYLFREMAEVVKAQGEGFVPYKWPKPGADKPVDKISYVKGFETWGWILGSGIYIDNVDTIFFAQVRRSLLIAFLITGIVGGLVYATGRSILIPTHRVSKLMENIAAGEGDLTKRLEELGNDEISGLSSNFNIFSEKIRGSLSDLSSSAGSVMGYADQLSETSHAVTNATQLQNDASTLVAAAMEQMSVNVKEVSNNADSAEQAALSAQNNTKSGKETLSSAIDQIHSLSGSINKVSDVVTKLSQESESIGTVLDVIRSIAEQTNLLALNAAIEAARAGEQGRGFAVVADEVRTLASRTGQSTEEIQQMISRLQSETQQAVAAVGESQKTSQSTIEIASQADDALTEIENLMTIISQMNSEVARATNQQAQAVDEVSERINELSVIADESSEVSQKLQTTGDHLRADSHKISEVIGRFKLN